MFDFFILVNNVKLIILYFQTSNIILSFFTIFTNIIRKQMAQQTAVPNEIEYIK